MEILIIQTAFPGDLFLSLPLQKQTRRYFPEAKISLLCRKGLGEVFLKYQTVDRVFEIKKGDRASYRAATEAMAQIEFDYILSPHRSFRTAWMIRQLRKKQAVGFKRWWNASFFDVRIPYPRELPDVLRQLALLREISPDFRKEWAKWDLHLSGSKDLSPLEFTDKFPEFSSMEVRPWRAENKTVYVAPGSVWATKKWPEESFIKLVQKILRAGFEVVLTGAPGDKESCDKVASSDSRIVNLCGKTSLEEILERYSKAQALVANDSGAIHMAAAVGLPTLAIFGPTVPEFGFRPWNPRSLVVQREHLKCRPCSPHGTKRCPIGTHECMKALDVDHVFRAFEKLIQSSM